MAVTAAALTEGGSGTDAASYTTASITPGANKLILAAVENTAGSGTANTPTLSGNGLTWVEVTSTDWGNALRRLTVFRAMGASPSPGIVTIDLAGQTATGCSCVISEFDGVDIGGTNGSAAVVQSVTGHSSNFAVTSLTVTLAAFGSTSNATYGAFVHSAGEGKTAGDGFTELNDVVHTSPTRGLADEWRADNDTTVSMSWATSVVAGGIAIEIKAAAAGTMQNLQAVIGGAVTATVAAAIDWSATAIVNSSASLTASLGPHTSLRAIVNAATSLTSALTVELSSPALTAPVTYSVYRDSPPYGTFTMSPPGRLVTWATGDELVIDFAAGEYEAASQIIAWVLESEMPGRIARLE